jgi:hypothetical protein
VKFSVTLTRRAVGQRLRLTGTVAAALVAAASIAACGGSKSSSSSTGTTTSASKSGSNTKFVACLKQHGVTISARTRGGFGGGRGPSGTSTTATPPSGTVTGTPAGATPPSGTGTTGAGGRAGGFFGGKASTKDEAAFKACAKYQVRGSFGRGAYGTTGGAGRSTYSTATLTKFVTCVRKNGYPQMPTASKTSSGGFFPKSIENNKQFQAAAKKCMSILRPSGGAPGSSTGTSTTAAS